MKVFLKKAGLILLIVLLAASLISEGSLFSLRQSSFYKPMFVSNSLKKTNYDYIILGSSIGLTTLDTQAIDSITSLQGINLSMDDTGLGSHYLMLQHFLSKGKTTKYCILATSATSLDVTNITLSTNDYRFLPYVRRDYVFDYFKNNRGKEARLLEYSKYLSFFGVSYYNIEILPPSIVALFNPLRRNRFDENGNYTYPVSKMNVNKAILNKKICHLEFRNPYLAKLDEVCRLNGISLIIYMSPSSDKSIMINKEVPFTILNHSDLLKNEIYFYDNLHVNSLGRKMSSKLFSEDFKKNIVFK